MKIRRTINKQPRVEMLPLIDIVFLLLIFFIYAMLSMAVHRGLNLDLPESSTAQVTKDDSLSISVKPDNSEENSLLILVDESPVDLENLGQKLAEISGDLEKPQALIFAEETISYQELFQVLDQVKKGGITEISLQANEAGK
jgi:biopolymer transport protein ExbD